MLTPLIRFFQQLSRTSPDDMWTMFKSSSKVLSRFLQWSVACCYLDDKTVPLEYPTIEMARYLLASNVEVPG